MFEVFEAVQAEFVIEKLLEAPANDVALFACDLLGKLEAVEMLAIFSDVGELPSTKLALDLSQQSRWDIRGLEQATTKAGLSAGPIEIGECIVTSVTLFTRQSLDDFVTFQRRIQRFNKLTPFSGLHGKMDLDLGRGVDKRRLDLALASLSFHRGRPRWRRGCHWFC